MSRIIAPGAIIGGRYIVEQEIGRGGMGVVYRASRIEGGPSVALKILSPHLMSRDDAILRFEREARLSSRLKHPNIVPVFDFGQDDGALWLAMGLLAGHSVRARLDASGGDGLPLTDLVPIGRDVASALVEAHAASLIHRDIKPENIFLSRSTHDGALVATVVDFGLAVALDDPQGRLTTEGVVFGSPAYMSPEQARSDRDITGATDVYGLGCVLYEMVCGRPPFPGGGLPVITRHLFSPPPPLEEASPNIDPRIADLIHRMLRKAPAERPTAIDIQHSLEVIAHAPRGNSGPTQVGRAARMVEKATTRLPAICEGTVLLYGKLDEDAEYTLAAHDLRVIGPDHPDADRADVILALQMSIEDIERLSRRPCPVIADTDPSDVQRMANLLRAGANAVLKRGSAVEEVLKTVRRALKRARRRKR